MFSFLITEIRDVALIGLGPCSIEIRFMLSYVILFDFMLFFLFLCSILLLLTAMIIYRTAALQWKM